MSRIFISHSSRDREAAERIRDLLEENGHSSVFLDIDPDRGIQPGADWEEELYRKLRACRALIALCSESSMDSKWCFAEITHARASGKPVFPIRLEDCEIFPVLARYQLIDLTADEQQGHGTLLRALKGAGLDPSDDFGWEPGTRPPYPGLPVFEEADAGVFFGREVETYDCIETLNRLRGGFGATRWLMVHGPSGCGKSSLVRAGVLPRLRRDADHWRVVDPFRPGARPVQALALALANLGVRREPPGWQQLRDELEHADIETASNLLNNAALDFLHLVGRPDASVILVLDQLEEILDDKSGDRARHFLAAIQGAAADPAGHLVVLSTVRSDFLGKLQSVLPSGRRPFESFPVAPIAKAGLGQVIAGPATVAGVELEPGLVEALVEDTGSGDALPLLAFALRELYERFGREDGVLTLSEYRDQLGGIRAALTRSADEILGRAEGIGMEPAALRRAFMEMIRETDEGRFVSHRVFWEQLPEGAHEVLEGFVRARLLVSGRDGDHRTLEVAHESLIAEWETLRTWVEAGSEQFAWRRRFEVRVEEWVERVRNKRPAALDSLFGRMWLWIQRHFPVGPKDRRRALREWTDLSRYLLLAGPGLREAWDWLLDRIPFDYWRLGARPVLSALTPMAFLRLKAKEEGWFSPELWRDVRRSQRWWRWKGWKPEDLPDSIPKKWRRSWPSEGLSRNRLRDLKNIAREEGWFSPELWRDVRKSQRWWKRWKSPDLPDSVPEQWRQAWLWQAYLKRRGRGKLRLPRSILSLKAQAFLSASLRASRAKSSEYFFGLQTSLVAIYLRAAKSGGLFALPVVVVLLCNNIVRYARDSSAVLEEIAAAPLAGHDSGIRRVREWLHVEGNTFVVKPLGVFCDGDGAPTGWRFEYVPLPTLRLFSWIDPGTVLPPPFHATLTRDSQIYSLPEGHKGQVNHVSFEGEEGQQAVAAWRCDVPFDPGQFDGWPAWSRIEQAQVCDDWDAMDFVGGVRTLYCSLQRAGLTEWFIEDAPTPVFLSGPHQRADLDLDAPEFGYYNPQFVNWAADRLIRLIPGPDQPIARAAAGVVYRRWRHVSRAYYLALQYLEENEELKDSLRSEVRMSTDPPLHFPRLWEQAEDEGKIMGLEDGRMGAIATVAAGFWIRREIDGSRPQFKAALLDLLGSLDGEFLGAHPFPQ